MTYDEKAKEKLGPPTTAVLERFAPVWLAKNQDLAMLGVALATETQAMIQRAGTQYALMHPELFKSVKPNGGASMTDPPVTQ
jgi:hypothetical protein